jgi:hypothetical protein
MASRSTLSSLRIFVVEAVSRATVHNMMAPSELARELGISSKTLRRWLRVAYPRFEPGKRWELSHDQVEAARNHWGGAPLERQPLRPKSRNTRAASDEVYVIDLLDELVQEKSQRQHRFDWLLGDPGRNSRRVELPVDAYWPELQLVVEYRERQHTKETPFFDKLAVVTVSGVHRGEQRRRYDARRDELIPAHGLRLLVVNADQLVCDARGKLKRERQVDRNVLTALLRRIGIAAR